MVLYLIIAQLGRYFSVKHAYKSTINILYAIKHCNVSSLNERTNFNISKPVNKHLPAIKYFLFFTDMHVLRILCKKKLSLLARSE